MPSQTILIFSWNFLVSRVLCGDEEQSLAELSSGGVGVVVVVVEEHQEVGDTRRSLHQLVQAMDHPMVVLHLQQVRARRCHSPGELLLLLLLLLLLSRRVGAWGSWWRSSGAPTREGASCHGALCSSS